MTSDGFFGNLDSHDFELLLVLLSILLSLHLDVLVDSSLGSRGGLQHGYFQGLVPGSLVGLSLGFAVDRLGEWSAVFLHRLRVEEAACLVGSDANTSLCESLGSRSGREDFADACHAADIGLSFLLGRFVDRSRVLCSSSCSSFCHSSCFLRQGNFDVSYAFRRCCLRSFGSCFSCGLAGLFGLHGVGSLHLRLVACVLDWCNCLRSVFGSVSGAAFGLLCFSGSELGGSCFRCVVFCSGICRSGNCGATVGCRLGCGPHMGHVGSLGLQDKLLRQFKWQLLLLLVRQLELRDGDLHGDAHLRLSPAEWNQWVHLAL
mmetsp:Transcript_16752/g.29342  ORF Transcript_16752/g.29342 Transcript_16752/m.29342 type:complete len:317 (-) Transcript_16752:737-1687(-)